MTKNTNNTKDFLLKYVIMCTQKLTAATSVIKDKTADTHN